MNASDLINYYEFDSTTSIFNIFSTVKNKNYGELIELWGKDQSSSRYVDWSLSSYKKSTVFNCDDCLGTISYGSSSGAAKHNAFMFFPTFPVYILLSNGKYIERTPDYYTDPTTWSSKAADTRLKPLDELQNYAQQSKLELKLQNYTQQSKLESKFQNKNKNSIWMIIGIVMGVIIIIITSMILYIYFR